MRKIAIRAGFCAAAVLTAAACGEGRTALAPTEPAFSAGPTVTVVVTCPSPIEAGQGGQCTAYGYDANGVYTGYAPSSWSSSNTGVATVSSGGYLSAVAPGTATVSAVVQGIPGSTSVTVLAASLSVSISGPSSVQPNRQCEWYASVTGGTAPYTYSWSQSTGSGSGFDDYYYGSSSNSFTLTVTVTDAAGQSKTASKWVSVSTKAYACLL
jgi:Bacterial Ig-like domain (group 2)